MTSSSASELLHLLTLQRRWREDVDAAPAPDEMFDGVCLVQAASSLECRVLPGSTLPEDAVGRVDQVLRASAAEHLHGDALVDAVRSVLDGATRFEGGPVHVFGAHPPAAPPLRGATTVTSADPVGALGVQRPPSSWDVGEWEQLLDGVLGPWAAVVVEGEVAALCHTARARFPQAVECGVWTDPRWRRRGFAAAAAAAWAGVVGGRCRHVFYSHDHRNASSAAVARKLGLRHLGWQWTISAEPWPEGDAWGDALVDHLRGRWTPLPELEVRGGGVSDAMHPEWFFRGFHEWDRWERELLAPARRSPALDLGAGAGRAALWLQESGVEVTAVDSSRGAVDVCRARGVRDVRMGDLNDPPTDKRWRLILLLCGNLGLGGSIEGNRRLLKRLAEVAAPDAVLVGDSVEPGGPPEIGLRIRYRGSATPWWGQCNIPVAAVDALVEGTGWAIERHVVDLPDHALLLRRS